MAASSGDLARCPPFDTHRRHSRRPDDLHEAFVPANGSGGEIVKDLV